jgi:hypothetical protein
MPLEVGFDSVDHGVALGSSQNTGEMFHDTRVSIEICERGTVGLNPPPQHETVCPNLTRQAHRATSNL